VNDRAAGLNGSPGTDAASIEPRVTPEAASMLITLAIEKTQPLTGTASCDGCGTAPFVGWMELLRAVADLVGNEEATGSQTPAPPEPLPSSEAE
jgi:hypothetical protein